MRRLVLPWTVLLLVALCGCARTAAPRPAATGYHGLRPDPRPLRPDFVLTDTNGHAFSFRARTGGAPTLLYFGYTSCADECPTAMAAVAAAVRSAPVALRERVRVVFVTTDPRRDTASAVRRWLDRFSPRFVGLRGTPAEVDAAQRASGVEAASVGVAPPGPPGQASGALRYRVAHSALVFAYDVQDRLPVAYPRGVAPSDIAADLPVLARRSP